MVSPTSLMELGNAINAFSQLYVALSHVQDFNNIRFYVTEDQLIETDLSATGSTIDHIVYQDVLALNDGDGERHDHTVNIDSSVENSFKMLSLMSM
jgi:hypothetical protein